MTIVVPSVAIGRVITIREVIMFKLPDYGYFHSLFGSDIEKCPAWFAIGLGMSLMLVMGASGLALISVIF